MIMITVNSNTQNITTTRIITITTIEISTTTKNESKKMTKTKILTQIMTAMVLDYDNK